MNKEQWLVYARNEIKMAERRTKIEYDDCVSDEEMAMVEEIVAHERQYISFLLSGIALIQDESSTIIDRLMKQSPLAGGRFNFQ